MNTAENLPPLVRPFSGSHSENTGESWPRMLYRARNSDSQAQLKKQRFCDDANKGPNPNISQSQDSGMLPPPAVHPNLLSQNNRTNNLFFKTRLCMKFQTGTCPYGPNCTFAHGPEDLHPAPPNWSTLITCHDDDRTLGALSDRQRMNKFKICRKYYNGEVCSYGERCTFAHVEPGSLRENSAISTGIIDVTALAAGRGGNGTCDSENNGYSGPCRDNNVPLERSFFWKTKICHKWELTGDCPSGENCPFAHGTTGTNKFAGHAYVETNYLAAQLKRHSGSGEHVPPSKTGFHGKQKGFPRFSGLKKISNIYADWLDDMPLNSLNS